MKKCLECGSEFEGLRWVIGVEDVGGYLCPVCFGQNPELRGTEGYWTSDSLDLLVDCISSVKIGLNTFEEMFGER